MVNNRAFRWETVTGRDLVIDTSLEGVGSLIPDEPGVYAWYRAVRAPQQALDSQGAFVDWIESEVGRVVARLGPTYLKHVGTIPVVEVGGRSLGETKRDFLSMAASSPFLRRQIIQVIEGAADHLPSLYVGQTSRLHARIHQHLNGLTSLADSLRKNTTLEFSDLTLRFARFPASRDGAENEKHREFREFIEECVTRISIGFHVDRVG